MTKQHTISDRVTVVSNGKIRTGYYEIESRMITVHFAGLKKSTQLGGGAGNLRPLAETILRELVSESKFD